MAVLARGAGAEGFAVAAGMLLTGVVLALLWPFRQLSILPVVALVILAPTVHGVLAGRSSRWTFLAGGLLAAAAGLIPLVSIVAQEGSACTTVWGSALVPLALVVSLVAGSAYVLAARVTQGLARSRDRRSVRLIGAIAAGSVIMTGGLAAWVGLFNALLGQLMISCT